MVPARRILHVPGQIKVLHLGSELGGEAAGVEQRDRAYPAPSFHLAFKKILHAMAQGRDHAHTGNHNSSSHARLESLRWWGPKVVISNWPTPRHLTTLRSTTAAHCPISVKPILRKW